MTHAPATICGSSGAEVTDGFCSAGGRLAGVRAAERGAKATVSRFGPMALMAYAQLDWVNADARYHAALLQVHTGDMTGPAALADTILKEHPGHLFGYLIRGTANRWRNDEPAFVGGGGRTDASPRQLKTRAHAGTFRMAARQLSTIGAHP